MCIPCVCVCVCVCVCDCRWRVRSKLKKWVQHRYTRASKANKAIRASKAISSADGGWEASWSNECSTGTCVQTRTRTLISSENKTKKQKRAKNREKHLLLSLQANRVLKAAEIFPLIFFFFSFFSFLSPTGVSQIEGSRSWIWKWCLSHHLCSRLGFRI